MLDTKILSVEIDITKEKAKIEHALPRYINRKVQIITKIQS